MRRLILGLVFLLAGAVNAQAQSTTVTGNVTDAGSQAWIGGTCQFQIFLNPQFPSFPSYTWTGGTLPQVVPCTLDGSGNYSASVPSSTAITPQGSKWVLQVTPNATSPSFSTPATTITGGSQTLNVTPPAIAIPWTQVGSPISAYSDSEIVGNIPAGAQYFNVLTVVSRIWNGTAWVNAGGGGGGGSISGGGTAGDIPVFTAAQAIGNSAWTDTLTTSIYHGTGGIGTQSVALTGVAPFSLSAIEGNSSTCLAIADGQDNLCAVSNLTPAGLWLSNDGGPYQPICSGASCGPPSSVNQLNSGGGVAWTGQGLVFTVSAANYTIAGTTYTSPQTNVTLAASDPTNPRIDVIAVDNTGTVVVLTGTPAPSPSTPVPNPLTQLALSAVEVAAGATTPVVTNILVYDENVGTPTEWNCTPTSNLNCNSTNNPYSFTHDIEATTAVAGNNAVLANTSTVNLATLSTLSFNIRNKATWPAAKTISICFLNGSTTVVGNCIAFKNGVFGFNQANLTSYQQIVIPLAQFALTGVVDRVRFQVAGTGAGIGFYLDLIQIQSGTGGGGSSGTGFQLEFNGTNTQKTANITDSASVTWTCTPSIGFSTCQGTATAPGGTPPTSAKVLGTNATPVFVAATQGDVSSIGYVAGGGTANAQTATLAPAVTALINGLRVCWKPTAANSTTTPTLAVNGLTATTIVKTPGNVALAANDLTTSAVACAVYDGTNFELQNPQTTSSSGVTSVGLALPSNLMTVSGSPVTSSGTLTGTLTPQNVGTVFAGPATLPGTNATLVQVCTGFNNATGVNEAATATCGSPVTAGDQLILWAFVRTTSGGGVSSFTFTDGPSDTFVSDVSFSNFDSRVSHVISAIGGNTTFTATPANGNSTNVTLIYVAEYKGITAFDAAGTTTQNSNPSTSSSPTTTATNDLLVYFAFSFATGQSNGTAAFNVEQTLNTPTLNANFYSLMADSGAAAIGTYTGTVNSTGTNTNQIITVAFKTTGTPTATPSFRKLVASDLPNVPNFLWADDQVSQTSPITTKTMFTVGSADAAFLYRGQINCRVTSSAAQPTLSVKYTDTSGTVQTQSISDTCTTLVTTGVPNLIIFFRAQAGSVITYAVAITAGTPTYDVSNRLSAQ